MRNFIVALILLFSFSYGMAQDEESTAFDQTINNLVEAPTSSVNLLDPYANYYRADAYNDEQAVRLACYRFHEEILHSQNEFEDCRSQRILNIFLSPNHDVFRTYQQCYLFHAAHIDKPAGACDDPRYLAQFKHPNYQACFLFHKRYQETFLNRICMDRHLLEMWNNSLYQECYEFHHQYDEPLKAAICRQERFLNEIYSHPSYEACYLHQLAQGIFAPSMRCRMDSIREQFIQNSRDVQTQRSNVVDPVRSRGLSIEVPDSSVNQE